MPEQRIEEVPVERVRFGFSPRAQSHDPDHVVALAEVLDDVPPILVQAGTLRVVDGVHRVLAARSVGRPTIRAVVFDGDEIAARVEAVRANVAHGKPLSLVERRAAAGELLDLVPDWSDRRVASVSGLSPKTVGRLRARATGESARSRARVGRDGRSRPVDTSAVRLRVAEAIRSDDRASNRAIARRTGTSPATVRDVRDRLHAGGGVPGEGSADQGSPVPAATGMRGPGPETASRPSSAAAPTDFMAWFNARLIQDAEWKPFVDAIPLSRVYEVADASLRCSDSWRALAMALEDRARANRRSGGEPALGDR